MAKYKISKLDAARRQLETAINLFFYERDSVSIHTLAAAAFNVLDDLRRRYGIKARSTRSVFLEHVREDKQTEALRLLKSAENFFKHADRDHEKSLSFNPVRTEWLLFDATILYTQITNENVPVFRLYYFWFIASNPEIYEFPEAQASIMQQANLDVTSTPKRVLWEKLMPLLSSLKQ